MTNLDRRPAPSTDENDGPTALEQRQSFPGKERQEPTQEGPAERIENDDPNAAENQGEPGQERPLAPSV